MILKKCKKCGYYNLCGECKKCGEGGGSVKDAHYKFVKIRDAEKRNFEKVRKRRKI
jgi:rRNA maturation protein Nop10